MIGVRNLELRAHALIQPLQQHVLVCFWEKPNARQMVENLELVHHLPLPNVFLVERMPNVVPSPKAERGNSPLRQTVAKTAPSPTNVTQPKRHV